MKQNSGTGTGSRVLTTERPPNSVVARAVFYATLVTAALLLLLRSTFYPDARIESFNFASTTRVQHNPADSPTAAPSTVQLPATNVSHILFGIAGSAATWRERSNYASLWWRPGVTRGHVWLDADVLHSDSDGWFRSLLSGPSTIPPYRISDPQWMKFPSNSSQSAARIARIVLESFKLGLPDVRWFVMGDDDTVFFPENLATVLGKYDHREMYYVGESSESVEQDELHSYDMAFGGGGFAISYRLAEELVLILDSCLERFSYFYGSDQRIWACIAELGVSLTREPGFHQLDVRGNLYGLLAAHPLAPLVSLHHLDEVESLFPAPKSQIDSIKSLLKAYKVDPGRILQRSFCYDKARNWTLSVSWGYTVQVWPKMIPVHDLLHPLQTFRTWRWGNGPFTFNTKEVSSDPCEQPVVYYMDRVDGKRNGSFSMYIKEEEKPGVTWGSGCDRPEYLIATNISNIAVTAPKMDLADWHKTPRRQCSEILDSVGSKHTMKLQLRKCQRGETISNHLAGSN